MVAARDGSDRIEIELTSNLPANRSPDGALVARPVDGSRRATDDRRLPGLAVAVGLVGLLAGVMIGRAAGGDDAAATVVTTEPAPSTDMRTADEPIPAPASSTDTATTEGTSTRGSSPPSRSTMTTITTVSRDVTDATDVPASVTTGAVDGAPSTPPITTAVAVDPAAARLPVEVVGRTADGTVVRLDLTTGLTTIFDQGAVAGAPVVFAGDDWVAIPVWAGRGGWTVLDADGTARRVDMAGVGVGWRHPTEGLFWEFDPDGLASEVDIDGAPTGRAFELPGSPLTADPVGDGLAVEAPGGVYVVGEASTVRLTSGRLVALGRERAVAVECDESLSCGPVVIERAIGEVRTLDLDLDPRARLEPLPSWSTAHPVDVAETAALVQILDEGDDSPPRVGVLDLATGRFSEISDRGGSVMPRWAPDGSSVFWLDRGRLRLFDLATGTSTDVAPDLGLLTTFTTRGSTPSVQDSSG